MSRAQCSIEGCDRQNYARSWCVLHYHRWTAHGDPLFTLLDPEIRFWDKVSKTETCWNWTASCNPNGYGHFWWDGRLGLAHRFAYQLIKGTIPDGLQIDHVCHNPACVNPDHLRLATNKQNNENRKGPDRRNATSGIRGVTWDKRAQRWAAQVKHNGRNHGVGLFDTIADAETAVKAKRNELFTHNILDRV